MDQINKVKIISGRSNSELAEKISESLGLSLTKCTIKDFGNTEIGVEITENIRGYHIYIVQTGGTYNGKSINDYFMELCAFIHACKLSGAKSVNVIIPCYPYARSDKITSAREPIMGSCVARILHSLGVNRIISMELHAAQIQGFSKDPFDNLYSINLHIENLKNTLFKSLSQEEINQKYILVAPDVGAIKRIEAYAEKLKMNYVVMHKHRDYNKPGTVLNSVLIGQEGCVKGKGCIVIDDIMDTLGTCISAGNELQKHGANEVILISTHGVFSGPAIERLNNSKVITKTIVTNTLPQQHNLLKTDKLQIVDASGIFASAIRLIETENDISSLLE